MSAIDPQMLKGLVSFLLLQLIAQSDDYGYALVLRLQQAGLSEIAEGTVYPALARCERSGWVQAYYVPSERGPARKYYRISGSGRDELDRAGQTWRHLADVVGRLTAGTTGHSISTKEPT